MYFSKKLFFQGDFGDLLVEGGDEMWEAMSQMPVVILITTFILDSRSIFSGSGIKFEFLSKEEKKQSQQQYFAKEIPPVKLLFCSVFTNAYTNHELPGLILPVYLPVD